MPAACADGSTPRRLVSEPGVVPGCTECKCGPRTGGSCTRPLTQSDKSCGLGASGGMDVTLTDGACHAMTQLPGEVTSFTGGPLEVVTPGSCPPSGGEVWDEQLREGGSVNNGHGAFGHQLDMCPFSTPATCEGGFCTVLPADHQRMCIIHDGDVACPSGWAPTGLNARAYDRGGYSDTRACATCTCEPTADTCDESIHYELFGNTVCGGVPPVSVSDNCQPGTQLTSVGEWSIKLTSGPMGTSACKVGGGTLSGALTPGTVRTLCCL